MTLKTFHFAGVASMNITLGVPRYNIHQGCVSVKDPFSFDADPGPGSRSWIRSGNKFYLDSDLGQKHFFKIY